MKIKLGFFITVLLLLIACKSYEPFTSRKEKKTQLNFIKNKFRLTSIELKKIENEDSILFTIAKSLRKKIKLSLIERRLDSFFVDNYDKKDLQVMLLIDYHLPNLKRPAELNRDKNAQGMEFKDIEEMKKFFSPGGGFEKDMNKMLGMKKKDSIKKKKNN
jgi:hypothetical protein